MARKARFPSRTGYYHVMVAGNNREHIFSTNIDKEFYLLKLKDSMTNHNVDLAAWCMLINNAHFLFKTSLDSLSQLMREVNTRYAILYNKKYDRLGHVFRGRFKCVNVEEESFLLGVVKYIHNRPTEKGMTIKAQRYLWSSFREYLTASKYSDKKQIEFILSYFNSMQSFKEFHKVKDFKKYLCSTEVNSSEQIAKASNAIKNFCEKHRIPEIRDIYDKPVLMQQLIAELLSASKLSNRKLASLIGISSYFVNKTSKLNKLI